MSHPLEISDLAFCNPPLEAVHPRMVDLGLRVKFRHLRSFYQPTERPSTGVLRREDVSVPRSSVVPKGMKEEVEFIQEPFTLGRWQSQDELCWCVNG